MSFSFRSHESVKKKKNKKEEKGKKRKNDRTVPLFLLLLSFINYRNLLYYLIAFIVEKSPSNTTKTFKFRNYARAAAQV